MKWTKEEINYLKNNYPTEIPLSEISKKIDRTIKSIKHKASRLELSRIKIPHNKPKNTKHRNIVDKNYYNKNKGKIYNKKKERIKKTKIELMNLLGGKCKKCGYKKCVNALEFHHKEKNKEGHLSKIIKNVSKNKALKEANKCILLCANCHRELHYKP